MGVNDGEGLPFVATDKRISIPTVLKTEEATPVLGVASSLPRLFSDNSQSRSMIVAVAIPCPMHILCRP